MKVKCSDVVDKLWFVITEIVVAVVYALSIYFRITSADFRINGYVWILIIDCITAIFSFFVIGKFVKNKDDNENRFIAYFYAVSIAIDTCLNDSLTGVLFISILLFYLIKANGIDNGYNAISQLFLSSVIGAEIVSLLSLMGIVRTGSIMYKWVESIWVDILLIVAMIIQICTQKNGKSSQNVNETDELDIANRKKNSMSCYAIPIVVLVIDVVCVVVLTWGLFLRLNSFYFTTDNTIDGSVAKILDASSTTQAFECVGDTIRLESAADSENQIFKFMESDVDGYYYIIIDDTNVFAINGETIESGDIVIPWEKNGKEGQLWKIKDVGNNIVQIVSYDDTCKLAWDYVEIDGEYFLRSVVTSGNDNTYFLLENTETINLPFVGWIVNSNKTVVIAVCILMMILIIISTAVVIVKR